MIPQAFLNGNAAVSYGGRSTWSQGAHPSNTSTYSHRFSCTDPVQGLSSSHKTPLKNKTQNSNFHLQNTKSSEKDVIFIINITTYEMDRLHISHRAVIWWKARVVQI